MSTRVADLRSGVKFANLTALVVERRTAVTKNGKPYVDLVLRDLTGTVKAKVWDYSCIADPHLESAEVITVSGDVSTYNNEIQVTVSSSAPSSVPATEFAKHSRFEVDDMWTKLLSHVHDIKEPMTHHVCKTLLVEHKEEFVKAPAAKSVHNAWYGGLLEHVVGMCSLAAPICKHYKNSYGDKFSTDKVMFGVILHDICKIYEYNYSTPAFQIEGNGILVNHLVLGPAMIYERCNRWYDHETATTAGEPVDRALFERERAHLMHLVASHHGKIEWGSPVVPSTLEAVLVHQLDMIDSKFMHALELVEGKQGQVSGFSENSWTEKTSFLM